MVFSSTAFLFLFLPVTLIVYYFLRNNTLRNTWLLLASLIFFGWSQPEYLWIIITSIVINHVAAFLVDNFKAEESKTAAKITLTLSVCVNLGLLFYFKYFDFVIDSVNKIAGREYALKNIVLPIGISFFTFQGLSYVVDVYRGDVSVQKNPLKTALYIVLFPQLIAGPIVRYRDVEKEISHRQITQDDITYGITRFIVGLSKKAIIANTMAEVVDSIWTAGVSNNTPVIAWIGSIAYSLQIFYDFSGYSDMAIGIGRMMGFRFCENFDRPYISRSITEFWRRWHMSLSTWFRDYVYIPLGGNRRHLYRNLIIVFLLTGLWHGAAWHYVAWGGFNGLFMLIERVFRKKKDKESECKLKVVLGHVYALLVINTGWVLFRADTITDAIAYLGTMLGIGVSGTPGFTSGWYLNNWVIFIFVVAIFDISGIWRRFTDYIKGILTVNVFDICKYAASYVIFVLAVMRIMSGTYNPFIYFQF